MTVYVFFWFDVEDYITPESDVALGRLVDIFDRHGLKATFKLVGEKVRGLQRRGHRDILTALRAHDVGYHTDFHSQPPSITEYLLPLDWEAGIDAFAQREQAGLETLQQEFDRVPACYGQPGGAWAPHVYPVLRRWGIPVYLDAGPWVNLDRQPHRYCDVLNILDVEGLLHIGIGGGADHVAQQQLRMAEAVERLRPAGGIVSLYAHECEFVTREFWDGVNFRAGRDTPREQWQPAPLVSADESAARYAAMDAFLTFVQSLPDVEVVVASQAPALFPDDAKMRTYTPRAIAALCAPMADAITHQAIDGVWLSPGEVFSLTVDLLATRARAGEWPSQGRQLRYVDGPAVQADVDVVERSLTQDAILEAALAVDAAMHATGRLPAQVKVGPNRLAPVDFLATVGAALPGWLEGDSDNARLIRGRFVQADYIPDHVSWDWIIFPPGFDGDPILETAKLQAWTLKPAP